MGSKQHSRRSGARAQEILVGRMRRIPGGGALAGTSSQRDQGIPYTGRLIFSSIIPNTNYPWSLIG
jgi:hypothetical protein